MINYNGIGLNQDIVFKREKLYEPLDNLFSKSETMLLYDKIIGNNQSTHTNGEIDKTMNQKREKILSTNREKIIKNMQTIPVNGSYEHIPTHFLKNKIDYKTALKQEFQEKVAGDVVSKTYLFVYLWTSLQLTMIKGSSHIYIDYEYIIDKLKIITENYQS